MMDCRIHSWISLYITAFLATTLRIERDGLYTPIFLAGPFFLALGSFIILSLSDDGQNAENIKSNVIRNALRRALLDVLSSIQEDVTEDEMLRLAMLRWIVDYWASSKKSSTPSTPLNPSKSSSSQTNRSNSNPLSSRNTSYDGTGNEDDNKEATNINNNSPKAFVVKASSLIKGQGQGSSKDSSSSTTSSTDINQPQDNSRIGWHDLSTMLDKTTEQMYNEVNPSRNERWSSRESNHTTRTAAAAASSRHQQNHSVRNLRHMISSFDVDERAKPAVLLYKNAVDGFPPSPNLSIAFALASRCPAILSVLYLHLIGSVHAINCTLTLFPMIIYEVLRVIDWVRRCRHFVAMKRPSSSKLPAETYPLEDQRKGEYFVPHFLREMESMEILLLDSSSLLRVWENVDSSVNALESGLTAMRCVNTLHVATDLVFNVVSLATFAVEVGNHGWLHGIQVLGSDLLHFHMKNTGRTTSGNSSERWKENRARYSNAAVDLVKNSQHLTRNMETLIDESKNETNFISCLLHSVLELFWGEGRLKSTDETNNHVPSNNNVHILPADSELESPAITIPICVIETTKNLSGACCEENVQTETISNRNENDRNGLRDEMPSSQQPMLTNGMNDLEVNFYQDEDECSRTRSNDDDESEIPHNEAIASNDDDDSWTAIHEEEKIPELKETPHPGQSISCTFDKKEIQDEGEYEHSQINESVDDAGIKWVGTGIAILGAVAGSILLASKNNGDTLDDKNKEDNVEKSRRSTVESIELLEDE